MDHSKIAFIDSGNTSIQVPESVFENLLNEMRTKEKTIGSYPVDDKTILVAHQPCDKLYDTLGDISFNLQGTKVEIKPRGYLYPMSFDMTRCFIGIEKIPDSSNQYRLGTIFLRNFYTALDFDNNLVLMGVNRGSSSRAKAYINGELSNPYRTSNGVTVSIIIVILLIAFGFAIVFYFK